MLHRISLLTVIVTLSFSSFSQMTPTLNDIWIDMRDGELLQADVYIPAGVDSGEVVLIQTPYNKDNFEWSLPLGVGLNVNSQPFIWVVADWRGFYGSNGADLSNFTRGEDGYDICEWITEQAWHKDRIGTWGPSALGGVQYNTAREQHPNHTCAVPLVAHPQQSYDSYFPGGVLEEARLYQLDALGYGLSPLILANPYYSAVWSFSENSSWYPEDIIIPTLQIGGWYDHNIDKMMDWYTATRTLSAAPVQDQQWLLVGPWVHGGTGIAYVGSATQGELSYPNAALVPNTMAWDFLSYYLLDDANNWQNTELLTYYIMGEDQWSSTNTISIENINEDVLYLSANGELISGMGSGSESFESDPHNPSPTIGGATLSNGLDQGPMDQNSLDSRSDILTYESSDLLYDVSISGRLKANLYVECDQPDADISIRLVDVYPDGRSMLINDGMHRMRFRDGFAQTDEAFMIPGNVYNVEVELPFTNYTWKAGHQIKIYVGGNNSIRYNLNLQNGSTMYAAGDTNIANIEIHHNATYPSRIILPGNNSELGLATIDQNSIHLSPNPATDVLNIESDIPFDEIVIYNTQGTLIFTGKGIEKLIDIRSLERGVYIVKFTSSDQTLEKRFVKL